MPDINTQCPMCQTGTEDSVHALINCESSQRIWRASKFGDLITVAISFTNWWNQKGRSTSKADMELIAIILWKIWLNRNSQVWNSTRENHHSLLFQAESYLMQWRTAADPMARGNNLSPVSTSNLDKWSTPPLDWVKCNVDASIFSNSICYGGIIRDSNGQVLAAVQGNIRGRFSPQVAEAIGLREVLSWLKNLPYSHVLVESDAQVVVNAVLKSGVDFSSFGLIINDCRSLVMGLNHCIVSWIRRSANLAAHSLARAAGSMSGQERWVMSTPPFILDVIASDLI